MNTPKDTITEFTTFLDSEVKSSLKELSKIKTESNRRHLQKLVYVNLVNRFDSFIDELLLQFSALQCDFQKRVLVETKDEGVFLKDIYEILLSDNPKQSVVERVEGVVRLHFLNQRHSSKLRNLLKFCFGWEDTELDRPRVFINNGSIFEDTKSYKDTQIPNTVIGYADWLYSKRNALVHGHALQFFKNDSDFIQKRFKIKVAKKITIKISSIKSAARFYSDLCTRLNQKLIEVTV